MKKNFILLSYGKYLKQIFPFINIFIEKGDFFIECPKEWIDKIAFFLKYHNKSQYKQLIDLAVVDFPGKKYRFELNYMFFSLYYNNRIVLVTKTQDSGSINSLCSIFQSANWMEREVWDLFGIYFYYHPDLRRILTDYGFKGHPLRKDFPLTGFIEIFYNNFSKTVEQQILSLNQQDRKKK